MVQRGAFTTMRSDGEIPIVVDHDMGRVVGRVTHLRTDEYVGPGKVDWWAAHADISDPPSWLKKQGGVSWDCLPLSEQDVNGTRRVLKGILREISILSPSLKPAEPLAQVTWIGQPETPNKTEANHSPASTYYAPVVTRTKRDLDKREELERRLDWLKQTGHYTDFELVLPRTCKTSSRVAASPANTHPRPSAAVSSFKVTDRTLATRT